MLQGVATASSSLVLGLALYHQPSLSSSPSSLLCVLVLVLATAVLGGLATGGINLLIQVTLPTHPQYRAVPAERLVGRDVRPDPGQAGPDQLGLPGDRSR